jgi:hypothetical protein
LVRYNNEVARYVSEFYMVSLTFDYYVIFNVIMVHVHKKLGEDYNGTIY